MCYLSENKSDAIHKLYMSIFPFLYGYVKMTVEKLFYILFT